MDKESLQLLLTQGLSVERIAKRFDKDPSTISYWLKKHGLESPYADKHSAKGGIERERLEELVGEGMTIAEIADAVGLSKGTVRHWLRRHGLQTTHRQGRRSSEPARAAKAAGLLTVTMNCRHHGETEFYLEGRGYYRCKRCRSEAVSRRRRKVKQILAGEAGGRCSICGYNRCIGALEFHHVDPRDKQLALGYGGYAHSLAAAREEAQKCVLLCSNCHVEIENGVAVLPARVLPPDP
jgi:transposase